MIEIDKYKQAEQLVDSLLNYSTNRKLMRLELARLLQFSKENVDDLIDVVLNLKDEYTKERVSQIVITILDTTCSICNLSKQELLSKTRMREITDARSIATTLSLVCCNISLQQVGRIFNQDHATILHSRRKYNQLVEVDAIYRDNVKRVLEQLELNGVVAPKVNRETFKIELIQKKKCKSK